MVSLTVNGLATTNICRSGTYKRIRRAIDRAPAARRTDGEA
jgi:aerobic-type carbon monoxide dehydrogenase small subunit (CoxS/CutS family)